MSCCDDKFSAAALKRRIVIEKLTLTPNSTGGQVSSWSTFATVWASIEPKTTDERFFAQRIEPLTTHYVRMRYLAGVLASMRIVYSGRVFQIKSVINVNEESQFLEIKASETTGT